MREIKKTSSDEVPEHIPGSCIYFATTGRVQTPSDALNRHISRKDLDIMGKISTYRSKRHLSKTTVVDEILDCKMSTTSWKDLDDVLELSRRYLGKISTTSWKDLEDILDRSRRHLGKDLDDILERSRRDVVQNDIFP